ncbi:hypothetical protein [Methylobacterium nodulans]|uniref:Uncharacterized protein n=1 Tax=Methylobacterium nodulans (strain LMG 21967 / CNCM I-2342 / ORS 2060) TaxID=460265 RepID=B8IRD1_METNO|nr:hypothetical protein [Methylobacterium nodulans]ACL58671.1 hypothetical protein Mnod_3765 [Methylobacterium nodulans ORS 2060]
MRHRLAIVLAALGPVIGPSSAQISVERDAARQVIIGDPSVVTCPAANCPAPPHPPVLSTQVVYGTTTKGPEQAEWLSSLGLFVKTGSPDGQKVTQYLGAVQAPGAGTVWSLNTDTVRNGLMGGENSFGGFVGSGKPGAPGTIGEKNGTIGYELDFTNWDAHSSPGKGPFTVGQYVHAQGSFTSLSAIYFDAHMAQNVPAWHNGIFFNGDAVVEMNTFMDATRSRHSLTVAGHHDVGLNTTMANADMTAVALRPGQTACFDGRNRCITWKDGRLIYMNGQGVPVFSVDEDGNASFRGRVRQNVR